MGSSLAARPVRVHTRADLCDYEPFADSGRPTILSRDKAAAIVAAARSPRMSWVRAHNEKLASRIARFQQGLPVYYKDKNDKATPAPAFRALGIAELELHSFQGVQLGGWWLSGNAGRALLASRWAAATCRRAGLSEKVTRAVVEVLAADHCLSAEQWEVQEGCDPEYAAAEAARDVALAAEIAADAMRAFHGLVPECSHTKAGFRETIVAELGWPNRDYWQPPRKARRRR